MKTRAARMVLATSVALATLAAAETAYAQDYQSYEAAYVHRRHAAPPTPTTRRQIRTTGSVRSSPSIRTT